MNVYKAIVSFLWGAVSASLVFLVFIFPPNNDSWTPLLILPLAVNFFILFVFCGQFIIDHWNDTK